MNKIYEDLKFLEFIEKLCKSYNISLFILFGSRAKGREKKTSDYDLAFYKSTPITSEEYIQVSDKIAKYFNNEKIDLIDIKQSKKLHVIKNIFLEGIPLYEKREGLFKHLKWSAWLDYEDFKKYYEKEKNITRKKLQRLNQNG